MKHKKDGGQSGGVFDSYIIVRVSSFIHSLQPCSFDLLNLTLLRQRIVIGCSRPPFLSHYLSNERANQTRMSIQTSKGYGAESFARLLHPKLRFGERMLVERI